MYARTLDISPSYNPRKWRIIAFQFDLMQTHLAFLLEQRITTSL